jgi:nucleotide-binding universal stress UspA family protein
MHSTSPRSKSPTGVHLVIGDDGSSSAACARQLIGRLSWPAGTTIDTVAAIDDAGSHFGRGPVPLALARLLALGAEELRSANLVVQTQVLRGFPGAAIVAAAGHTHADLVVVGARSRHGQLSAGLGPISRFAAERAQCHVLIARRASARKVLIGHDGTEPSRHAIHIAATWPMFEHLPIHLVSVVEMPAQLRHLPFSKELVAMMPGTAEALQQQRALQQTWLLEARAVLEKAGRTVTTETRVGHTAQELLMAADALDADVLVVGTRRPHHMDGSLGAVAGDLLAHAGASVLLVRAGVN